MNAQSLFASAAINIGLALITIFLFSILKKQPSNAAIYYARPLSQRHPIPSHHRRHNRCCSALHRFLPSVSWIPQAFRVSEDEILQTTGLDALVVIRLFKFGLVFLLGINLTAVITIISINFFVACSLVGLLVLLPVNYTSPGGAYKSLHSMDSFTISNIGRGSNRLWVHFSCLCFISFYGLYLLYKEYKDILEKRIQQLRNIRHQPAQFTVLVREIPLCGEHKTRGCSVDHFFSKHYPYSYQSYQMLYDAKGSEQLSELPVAFVTFKSRWGAAVAAQGQQHSHPLLWITEMAPEPRDVLWDNLATSYRCLPLQNLVAFVAASLLTIFFAIPVTAVQGIAKFEKLRKWFPPAMAIQLIPGLRSVVTGYLPSAVLKGFIYIVPFAMLGMAKLAGCVSRSKQEIKSCSMVFYFLVGNVFFLSLLSGSLLDEIGESFSHPKNFPSHLAAAVSAQADFFMTYILTDGLSGFSLEVLQPGLLIWDFIKSHTYSRGKEKAPYIFSVPYCRVIPFVSLSILIGMVYAVIAPLLLPFLIVYFFFGYAVYINQIQDVYETVYETCGQYWPYIHHFILVALVLMQITMIGIFGLKAKPAAAISTIPLLLFTIMFNEYCKIRFRSTFYRCSIQNAVENDELDEKNGLLEANCENAHTAYCRSVLRPQVSSPPESSSTQPLVSST